MDQVAPNPSQQIQILVVTAEVWDPTLDEHHELCRYPVPEIHFPALAEVHPAVFDRDLFHTFQAGPKEVGLGGVHFVPPSS